MDEKKEKNGKVQIVFSTLILAVAFFLELYVMINNSQSYALIGVFAIIALLALYYLVNGIIDMAMQLQKKKEEQYDNLYRSEKASYLMMKKRFEELEQEVKSLERTAIIPVEEIVSAQKGIAKLIINKNRENADEIIGANGGLDEKLAQLSEQIDAGSKKLLDEEKSFSSESFKQMMDKQQEIALNLKDMEIRLNTSIMQSQKMIAEQRSVIQQPQVIQQPYVASMPVQQPVQAAPIDTIVQSQPEPVQAVPMDMAVPNEPEPVPSAPMDIEMPSQPEPAIDIAASAMDAYEPELSEPAIANEEMPELAVGTEELPEPAIIEVEESPEPVVEEAEPVIEEAPAVEPVAQEEKPPMPDLSDPNKPMSPDDIAALLANMTQDAASAEPQAVPEQEPVMEETAAEEAEPVIEEAPAAEPVAQEEKPPMPDLSDPNKPMSPDDIAALLANMTQDVAGAEPQAAPEPEPVIEEAAVEIPAAEPIIEEAAVEIPEPIIEEAAAESLAEEPIMVVDDAPEEDSLIDVLDDIVPDQLLQEVNDQVKEAEEDKPPMPDLSDPNKKLSADEIAALFANL